MFKFLKISKAVALPALLFLTLNLQLSAQNTTAPKRLRDVLSADSLLYVDAPDFQSTIKRGKDIPVAQILREEEFQEFLMPVWKTVRERIDLGLAKIGEKPENWKTCPLRSFELGFGSLAGSTEQALFVKIDCGQLNGVIKKLLDLPEGKLMFQRTEEAGAQLLTMAPAPNVAAALRGDELFFVVNGMMAEIPAGELAADLLKALGAAPAKGFLAADADFMNLSGKMTAKQPEWITFLRPARIASEIVKNAVGSVPTSAASRPGAGRTGMQRELVGLLSLMSTDMKLDQCNAAMFSESYINGLVNSETAVLMPPNSPLLAGMLGNGKPVDRAFLDKALDGVDGFTVYNIDPKQIYTTIIGAVNKFYAQNAASRNPLALLEQYEKEKGISIESDLIAQLGPEYYHYSFPPKSGGGGIPTWDTFFVVKIHDKAKVEKALNVFVESLKAVQQGFTIEVSDPTPTRPAVYTIKLVDEPGRGNPAIAMLSSQATISMSIADEWLLVSTSALALKNELRNMKKPRDASADVKKKLGELPAEAASLAYYDWRPSIRTGWDALAGVAALAGGRMEQMPLDLQKIPTSQSITKHLKVSTSFWTLTKDGAYGRSSGSFGLELYGTIAGIAGAVAFEMQQKMMSSAADIEEDEDAPPAPKPADRNNAPAPVVQDAALQLSKARDMILRIDAGVKIYKAETGKLPAELSILLKANDDHPQGYLPGLKELPKDPWGADYLYEVAADGKTYQLRSKGPDGKDNTGAGDDVKADN